MLEPRESDIPVLFLVLVVLPLVAYILLGKWSETTKRRDRINLLAHLAAEEALRAEEMAVADVLPPASASKNEHHGCARCSAPARTRCSRCKSVRYCSGNCQIIHWRLIHKQECQQLEPHKSSSFPLAVSVEEFGHGSYLYENLNNQFLGPSLKQTLRESAPLDALVHPLTGTAAPATDDFSLLNNFQPSTFDRTSNKSNNRETRRRDSGSIYESSDCKASSSLPSVVSKEAFVRQKSRNSSESVLEEEISNVNSGGVGVYINRPDASKNTTHEDDNHQNQYGNAFVTRNKYGRTSVSSIANNDNSVDEFETDITTKGVSVVKGGNIHSDEAAQYKQPSEMTIKGNVKAKKILHTPKIKSSKSPKSTSKTSTDFCCSEIEKNGKTADEPKVAGISDTVPLHGNGSNGAASTGIMKMMGLRKSTKPTPLASTEGIDVKCKKVKKIKMLFPYDDFVKIFQSDVFGICPRGLLNCGNSCYANAVLQCLTSTKPLVV